MSRFFNVREKRVKTMVTFVVSTKFLTRLDNRCLSDEYELHSVTVSRPVFIICV